MEKSFYKAVDELVLSIKDSYDYQKCIKLKEQMALNEEIKSLVNEIKIKQKKYVREEKEELLVEIESLNKRLLDIPIYVIYMQHLAKVNWMIDFVKDDLNNYFDKLLNEENK